MSDIATIGIVCGNCRWRNNGGSNRCVNCSVTLIAHRSLDPHAAGRWVEDQMSLRNQLGIATSVDDLEILRAWATGSLTETTDRTPTPPSVFAAHDESLDVAVICDDCGKEFSDPVKFCSECGGRTRSPEGSEIIVHVEQMVRHLLRRVEQLERGDFASTSPQQARAFRWTDIDNDQKWQVTWGVYGRTILINIGISVAVVVFFVLVLGLGVAVR